MERERNYRSILIGVLCVTVFCMSIGFAYLSQQLQVNGTLNVDSATWDIQFASITPGTASGFAVSNAATLADNNHTAVFDLTMAAPGDSITYTLVVNNNGSLAAKVNSITVTPTSDSTIDAANNIIVTTSGINTGDIIAAKSGTTPGTQTLIITFNYNPDATSLSASTGSTPLIYSATIDYVQNH